MNHRYLLASIAVVLIAGGLVVAHVGAVEEKTSSALSSLESLVVEDAEAWPVKSNYSGHSCVYYAKNGNNYAMCWAHSHSVPVSKCVGTHEHHVQGYIRTPGGWYSRIWSHDHHMCASPAPHFGLSEL